jgi:NTP pyrophosphatase (non-canonical NTP hydrolase)
VNYRAKIQEIMAHLQEEIGEVSSCLNDFENDEELKQDADRLFEFQHEIADVVTWIVAITLKIDYLLAAGANYLSRNNLVKDNKNLESALGKRSVGLSLPTIIWDVYKDPNDKLLWCPSCGKEICDQSNEKKNSIELDN